MNADLWKQYTDAVAADREARKRLAAAEKALQEAKMAAFTTDSDVMAARLTLLAQEGGEYDGCRVETKE